MRVVFYTRSGYLDGALQLVEALARRHEVHLVVERSPEGATGPLGLLPEQPGAGVHPATVEWLPPRTRERLASLASFHFAAFTHPRAFHPSNVVVCLRLARLIRSWRPDVVHFDEASTRAATLLYALGRLPLVLSIHDSHPRVGERKGRFELVRSRFVARAKAMIFHSRYAAEEYAARASLPARLHTAVIPLGVYDLFRDPCEPVAEDALTVLFFGRIAPYKGIEVLVRAAPEVARRIPGVGFVVAGAPVDGYAAPGPPALEGGATWELAARHLSLEEVCGLFHRAAVVVLPYVEASQSGVVSTALAFDKPVVATAVGGIPETVADGVTGLLVPPGDPAALAAALGDVLADAALGERLRGGARALKQGELSWDSIARATEDCYGKALGRGVV